MVATESTQAQILRAIGALKDELLRKIDETRDEFVPNVLAEQRQRETDARLARLENRPASMREWMFLGVAVVALAVSSCSLLAFVASLVAPHLH